MPGDVVINQAGVDGEADPQVNNNMAHQAAIADPEAAPAVAPVPRPVYVMARESKIKRFYGEGSGDSEEVDDFITDIRRVWSGQTLSRAGKLDIIRQNVGPLVKDEILCLETEVQQDPEQVLNKIREVFGERRSVSELLQVFYNIKQESGERVRVFSHRCKAAFSSILNRQRVLKENLSDARILRDHFISHLGSEVLVANLREEVYQTPGSTFHHLREKAIRFANDERPGAISAAAVTASVAPPQPAASTPTPGLESVLGAILEKLEELSHPRPYHPPQQRGQRYNNRRPPHNDGKCFHCNQAGHWRAECPALTKTPKNE